MEYGCCVYEYVFDVVDEMGVDELLLVWWCLYFVSDGFVCCLFYCFVEEMWFVVVIEVFCEVVIDDGWFLVFVGVMFECIGFVGVMFLFDVWLDFCGVMVKLDIDFWDVMFDGVFWFDCVLVGGVVCM